MENKEFKPSIRFNGFTDPWEQRKLGEILKYEQPQPYIVKNTKYDDRFEVPVLTAGQSFILGYTDETFGIKKASKNNPVIIFDDFTTSTQYVDFNFKVKSSAMKLLTLSNENDDIYCAYYVLKNIGYEPANHERHWISKFSNFNILMPKVYDEQKQIGTFLEALDNLITLQKHKVEKLKNLKSAMLDKMFPKEGSNVPEIRFKGFTEPWEQRELGNVSEKVTKKNQDMVCDEVFTNSAEYGIISQRDFFDKDIANSENIDGYYIVEPDDFVYNPRISNLAPFGPIRRNKLEKSGAMSPLYYVFRTHGVDYGFLEYYFKTNGWHSFMHLNGNSGARSDRFAIRDDIFKEMPITMPQDIVEQKAIGQYFTNLDNLITLHQRKCEKLIDCKKAFLEKMIGGEE